MSLTLADKKTFFTLGFLSISLSLFFGIIIFGSSAYASLVIISCGLGPFLFYLLSRLTGGVVLLFLLLGIPVLELHEGISLYELPFYSASCLVAMFVLIEIITGKISLNNTLDKLFFFLLILLFYGAILGILNQTSPKLAVGELSFFVGILYYFPIKSALPNKMFQKVLLLILFVYISYVLIRNAFNYREIIAKAVLQWQAEKARVAANEFILLMGCTLSMSLAATAKKITTQFIFTILFLSSLAGLILTQSRGYWLAFLFGALSIFLAINWDGKKRILLTLGIMGGTGAIVGLLLFNNIFTLIIDGLILRFQSIGSGKPDTSLLDRYYESIEIIKLIAKNPIAGYGLGTRFTRHSLISDVFINTSFIHNGYLAAWFKFGIAGFLTFISIWFLNIKYALQVYRSSDTYIDKGVSLAIIGTIAGVFLVNNTSAQILLMESVLFISIGSAF